MSKEPVKQTAYSDYLYNQVERYFREVGWGFSVDEIADYAHLKVTGNMRRRLNHAVKEGKLSIMYTVYRSGKRTLLYYLPNTIQYDGEPPF